mgnify:CR=1 FL=1
MLKYNSKRMGQMAIVNILENFNPETNAVFVEKAESLRPKLIKTKTKPISIVEIYKGKMIGSVIR